MATRIPHRPSRAVYAMLVTVSTIAMLGRAPRALGDEFSPQAVFSLPDHQYIDSRCGDARSFADKASHGTDSITALEALGGAKAFAACFHLANLNPDLDHQRYLALAAATALYLAGTKVPGSDAIPLFKNADSIASDLGAALPENSPQVLQKPGEEIRGFPGVAVKEIVSYDPHGQQPKLKYIGVATALRASIADQVNEHLHASAPGARASDPPGGNAKPPEPTSSAQVPRSR